MSLNLMTVNLIISLALLFLVVWQMIRIARLTHIRKHFYSSGLKKNLETILTEQDQNIKKLKDDLENFKRQIEEITLQNQSHFQRMGFVRFSPYGESGNLSFALAILDDLGNGLVLSSLHNREGNRVYSKEIKNWQSASKLTEEEKQTLEKAKTSERV